MQPITIEPIFKNRVWGGNSIGHYFAASSAGDSMRQARQHGPVGEAWLLADLDSSVAQGACRIADGPHAGKTLRDVLSEPARRLDLLGRAKCCMSSDSAGFPLLIKLLDARENLSLQVHPDAKYAKSHVGTHVKDEVWHVLAARPGAKLYRGVRPEVSRQEFEKRIHENTLLEVIIELPVKPGDSVRVPSGICHALGAGLLVAEVQTPSDTTFRVWDWGRNDPARKLHISEAVECTLLGDNQHLEELAPNHALTPSDTAAVHIESIAHFDSFAVEKWAIAPNSVVERIASDVPVVWTLLSGSVNLEHHSTSHGSGATIVFPAHHDPVRVTSGSSGATVLVSLLPDPLLSWAQIGGCRAS